MDRSNRDELRRMARDRAPIATRCACCDRSIPTRRLTPTCRIPYYGGPRGFEDVFDICERACRGLLAALLREAHGGR